MKKILIILFLVIPLAVFAQHNYYVSPYTGSDSDSGLDTANAFLTPQHAIDVAEAGDSVYYLGGTYNCTSLIVLNPENSHGATGTRANPIVHIAYPGDVPIWDFSGYTSTSHTNYSALSIYYSEFVEFNGITICNLAQTNVLPYYNLPQGIATAYCRYLTFKNMTIHDIGGRGVWTTSGAWKEVYDDGYTGTAPYWDTSDDTTRFINCDFYDLCDSLSADPGNAGDGVIGVNYKGNYWLFQGCRAWYISDDCFDVNPLGGLIVFDSCWTMSSSKYEDYDIEGDGFKLNANDYAYDPSVLNDTLIIMKNCLAAYNLGVGFYGNLNGPYENHAVYYNNTAYRNGSDFFDANPEGDGTRYSTYHNNIAYGATGIYEAGLYSPSIYNESHNTWDAKMTASGWPGWVWTDTVTVSDADFVSVDSSQIHAARKSNGSLPDIDFLHLAASSDLIDAGKADYFFTHYGMTYEGSAPDIGYAEYTAPSEPSSANNILAFTVPEQTGASVINSTEHTVTLTIEYSADIEALTPTIVVSAGATIDPASGVEGDFTDPVIYTVTAEDESEQEWTITVSQDEEPELPSIGINLVDSTLTLYSVRASVQYVITSKGGDAITARGICWNTTGTPTISDTKTIFNTYNIGSPYIEQVRGLHGGITYYLRGYATNGGGTQYTDELEFTTPEYTILKSSGNKILRHQGKITIIR